MTAFFWVTGVAALVVSAVLLVASYRESAAARERDAWRQIARRWGGE